MDIVEQLRKSANTIYKQDGYTFRLGLQNEAADEIERLRDALTWIERHPVEESKQWEVAVKEMKRLARSALPQKEKE